MSRRTTRRRPKKNSTVSGGGTQALALGALLMAAILGFWWAMPDDAQSAGLSSREEGREAAVASSAVLEPPSAFAEEEVELSSRSAEQDSREEVASVLEVFVLDPSGRPVPGARVSWTGSSREGVDLLALDVEELQGLVTAGLRVETGEEGVASFDARPEDVVGSVVWVTSPGFAPASLLFSEEGVPQHSEVRLAPAAALEVTVLSARGEPAAGANVYQLGTSREEARRLGFLGEWASPEPGVELPAQNVLQELSRVSEADGEGRAEVTPGAPVSLFLATSGTTRSSIVAVAPGETTLQLRLGDGVFSVGGTVLAGGDAGAPDSYRVSATWRHGNLSRPLGEVRPSASGEWGPLQLPVMESGRLELAAHGEQGFTAPVVRDFPLAGEVLVVDFQAEPAHTEEVLVRDEAEQPLEDVRVRILWQDGGSWAFAEAWSDAEGVAVVKGCKQTTTRLVAESEGYVSYRQEHCYLPSPAPLVATMARARTVRGRVTFEGEPVEDFDVAFWREEKKGMAVQAFTGRKDGEFELSAAMAQAFFVSATAEGLAQSESVLVPADFDPQERIELELVPGKRGRGRVLDATTSSPLAGVRVQRLVHGKAGGGIERGDPILTQADGRFELTGMSEVERILVSADGYETASVNAAADDHGVVDFGVVSIGALATLEVRVLEEAPFVYGKWWFYTLEGPTRIPLTPVMPDGTLTVEGVSAGNYRFCILTQDSSAHVLDRELILGEAWTVEFPIAAGKSLEVTTKIPAELDVEPMMLFVNQEIDGVFQYFCDMVHEGRKQTVGSIQGDRVSLFLIGEQSGALRASQHVDLSGPGPYSTVLVAEDANFTVQLSADGDVDLAAGSVGTAALGAVSDRPWMSSCNDEGVVSVARPAGEEFLLMYMVSNQLLRFRRLSRSESYERVVEFELGPGWEVELEVLDVATPVAGARWQLHPPGVRNAMMDGRCGDDGRSGVRDLGDGTYKVQLSLAGYWTTEYEVPVASSGILPLQLRRRGSLRMTLRTAGGTPVKEARISLRSIEYGVAVEDWLSAGRLSADSTRLVTDGDGVATVAGVPHGEYQWTATSPSGETKSGVVTVPPGEWGAAELRLGD